MRFYKLLVIASMATLTVATPHYTNGKCSLPFGLHGAGLCDGFHCVDTANHSCPITAIIARQIMELPDDMIFANNEHIACWSNYDPPPGTWNLVANAGVCALFQKMGSERNGAMAKRLASDIIHQGCEVCGSAKHRPDRIGWMTMEGVDMLWNGHGTRKALRESKNWDAPRNANWDQAPLKIPDWMTYPEEWKFWEDWGFWPFNSCIMKDKDWSGNCDDPGRDWTKYFDEIM